MRPIHIPSPLLLLGAAVTLACSDRAPQPLVGPRPAFDFTNGPASPGESGILRFNDLWLEVISDPVAGFKTIHGLPGSVDDFCDGLGAIDEASIQVKTQSAGEVNSLVFNHAQDVQVFAYIPGRICLTLRGVTPVARGTVNWRRTDNNLTPTGTEGGRADSFGFTSEGTLDAAGGGQVRYSDELRLVINPRTNELSVKVSNIGLTPIP
jgi:hypothetical protein